MYLYIFLAINIVSEVTYLEVKLNLLFKENIFVDIYTRYIFFFPLGILI